MMQLLRRIALSALITVPILMGGNVHAQTGPTPEGTVIVNTASVRWTDANNNTYQPVTASASVTVGFLAGIDIQSAAALTPTSASSGNLLGLTVVNLGNGTDSVRVSVVIPAGVTVTAYIVDGIRYATLEELNAALAALGIAGGESLDIDMEYSVDANLGGVALPIEMTAVSRRDPTVSDTTTTVLTPETSRGVTVTPDGGSPIDRVAGNSVAYTETFTIENQGNAPETFQLLANGGSVLTILSVNGTSGTTGTITLAAGQSATFTVTYLVATNTPVGTTQELKVTATATSDANVYDTGFVTIEVIGAGLTMSKTAFVDDQTSEITSLMTVLPGDFIQYRIAVTNNSSITAQSVRITDALPAQLLYVDATGDTAGWTFAHAGGTVTADLAGELAPGDTRFIWIRAQVR
jgi:large repetitive protein